MKVLITSGGTSEKIDEVRKITNTATGRLGSIIADEFINRANAEITYVCGENAVKPMGAAEITGIVSAGELHEKLSELLTRNKYDAVIHTMAVSDYTVKGAASATDLTSVLAKTLYEKGQLADSLEGITDLVCEAILQSSLADGDGKISSDITNLMLLMDKTPKVISLIKQLQPQTCLVGFKLLSGVSEEELLKAGHSLLVKNNCNFVLANDLNKISADSHEGLLIEPNRNFTRLKTKQEIASKIADSVLGSVL